MRNAFFRKIAINFFKRGIALLLLIFLGLTVYANPSRSEADTGRHCSKGKVSCSTADCAYSLPSAGNKNVRLAAGGGSAGSKSLIFDDAENPAGASRRTGTITAGGKAYAVNQAPSCTYVLQSTDFPAPSAAGTVNVKVTVTGDNCSWSATVSSNASSWLTVAAAGETQPFIGTKTLSISYAENIGAARTGTITIAGNKTYTVRQDAPCECTFDPSDFYAPSDAGSGTVKVNALNNCSWAASASAEWIRITSGADATGNGEVTFSYAENTSHTSRTGTISIGTYAYTVNQAGATCVYTFVSSFFFSCAPPRGGGGGGRGRKEFV